MAKVDWIINGKNLDEPFNAKGFTYNLDFENGSTFLEVPELDFRMRSHDEIQQWVNSGKVFEGVPIDIRLDGDLLSRGSLIPSEHFCDKTICEFQEKSGFEWLNNQTRKFTFETLFEEGLIKESDYIQIPYYLSELPRAKEFITLTISVNVMLFELFDSVQSLIDYVAGLPPLDWGEIFAIISRIVYIGTLVGSIIALLNDVFDTLIQKTKYLNAMYLQTLLEKGAEKLGLKFKSSLITGVWKKAAIIPQKYRLEEGRNGVLGFFKKDEVDQTGYFRGTCYDLLIAVKQIFNAEFEVIDGTLYLERDFSKFDTVPKLEPVEILSHRTNKGDFVSNLILSYAVDSNDKNTIQSYSGTSVQYITEVTNVTNKGNLTPSNVIEDTFPFARGIRKESLTPIELAFKALALAIDIAGYTVTDSINTIIKAINGIVKFINKLVKTLNKIPGVNIRWDYKPIRNIEYKPVSALIGDRIGGLLMENDFVLVPKLVFVDSDGKLITNQPTARMIGESYHTDRLFDPAYNNNNQKYEYSIPAVHICKEDLMRIKNTKSVIDPVNNKVSKVRNISWDPISETGSINYGVPIVYTKNLKTKIIEPDGK